MINSISFKNEVDLNSMLDLSGVWGFNPPDDDADDEDDDDDDSESESWCSTTPMTLIRLYMYVCMYV